MADIETITSLAKRRGFAFQSSDVYGGLGSVWDYGPLGVEIEEQRQARVVESGRLRARRYGGA